MQLQLRATPKNDFCVPEHLAACCGPSELQQVNTAPTSIDFEQVD
jgi:hypothetical protein